MGTPNYIFVRGDNGGQTCQDNLMRTFGVEMEALPSLGAGKVDHGKQYKIPLPVSIHYLSSLTLI